MEAPIAQALSLFICSVCVRQVSVPKQHPTINQSVNPAGKQLIFQFSHLFLQKVAHAQDLKNLRGNFQTSDSRKMEQDLQRLWRLSRGDVLVSCPR